MTWENGFVLVSIEVPEQIMAALQERARDSNLTVQDIALEAIRRDVNSSGKHRVQLPLIRSANPGTLNSMTNVEIDEILGD